MQCGVVWNRVRFRKHLRSLVAQYDRKKGKIGEGCWTWSTYCMSCSEESLEITVCLLLRLTGHYFQYVMRCFADLGPPEHLHTCYRLWCILRTSGREKSKPLLFPASSGPFTFLSLRARSDVLDITKRLLSTESEKGTIAIDFVQR